MLVIVFTEGNVFSGFVHFGCGFLLRFSLLMCQNTCGVTDGKLKQKPKHHVQEQTIVSTVSSARVVILGLSAPTSLNRIKNQIIYGAFLIYV